MEFFRTSYYIPEKNGKMLLRCRNDIVIHPRKNKLNWLGFRLLREHELIFVDNKDIKQVSFEYNRRIEKEPDNPGNYVIRGFCYYFMHRREKAYEDFSAAIALDEIEPYYYLCRAAIQRDNERIEDLNRAIALNDEYFDAYWLRALTYQSLDMKAKAIEDYSELLNIKGGYNPAYYNRGCCFYGLGDCYLAIKDFTTLIEMDEEDIMAVHCRGECYMKLCDYEKALEDFERAATWDDFGIEYRAECHNKLGNYEDAVEDYTT
ncbi:MAG: tetratricopeptide repeat protein, partial [Ignavibacteria bacterium]